MGLIVALVAGACGGGEAELDLVLRGGTVVDGTGAGRFVADIGITGDRIEVIADRIPDRRAGKTVHRAGEGGAARGRA